MADGTSSSLFGRIAPLTTSQTPAKPASPSPFTFGVATPPGAPVFAFGASSTPAPYTGPRPAAAKPAPSPFASVANASPKGAQKPSWSTEIIASSAPKAAAPSVDIKESRFAKERARLMELINALAESGASLELDVPRIAVIGNQSAGKSSLVEAISGIEVPRSSGTCTRTPFEVQLRSSPLAWSCNISLRLLVDEHGAEQAPRQVAFGPTLLDPAQVEPMLRKAQLAILHPEVAPSFFIDLDASSVKRLDDGELPPGAKKRLSFSSNLVCVRIEGPEAVDLTFLDLPGIISNVSSGQDPNDVQLVRDLVKRHIAGNCLILCAFSMKDDLENQSCGLLAKESDPEGNRTIGVLTKADTLQEGEHARWLEVLRGESKHRLAHGYFCTKLRGTADLEAKTTSYEESRAAEAKFFSTVAPWSTLRGPIRDRLGTKQLVEFLGERLAIMVSSALPELMSKSSSLLAEVQAKLAKLPAPPASDPLIQLGTLIDGFVSTLRSYSTGSVGCKSLFQDVGGVLDAFKLDIQATEPRFTPFEGSHERRGEWVKTTVAISSGEKGRPAGPANVASRKRRLEEVGEEVKKEGVSTLVLEMDIDQVHDHIKKARTRELPNNVPYDAKTDLIAQSLRSWPTVIDASLERVRPIVHKCVQGLVGAHFKAFDQAGLCSMVRAKMSEHLDTLFTKCREHLDYFVSLEQTTTTRNTHYHSSTHGNLVRLFNTARKDPPSEDVVRKLHTIAIEAGQKVSREDIVQMLGGKEYVEEIDTMASVQAYWKVAYKRIIDNIPRAIDADIVQRLHEDVQHLLTTKVGLYGTDAREKATKLVSEKASITKERNELLERVRRLEEGRALLSKFGEGDSD